MPHDRIVVIPPDIIAKPGIHLIEKPEECRSYLIVFTISIDTISKTIGVPFPGPGDIGWERYSEIGSINNGTPFSLVEVTSREFIDNREFVNAYDYLYDKV